MTSLDAKEVRRKTKHTYAVLYPAGKPRQIVAGLAPGDILTFRELGRREVWTFPIDRAFRIAVRETQRVAQSKKKGSS